MLFLWTLAVVVLGLVVLGLWMDHHGRGSHFRVNPSAPHRGDPEAKLFDRYGNN